MPTVVRDEKSSVRQFWEARPCGSVHADAPEGTADYFDQIERRRLELEPFIAKYADLQAHVASSVMSGA